MSLCVCLLLLVVALVLQYLGRRRMAVGFAAAGLGLMLLVGSGLVAMMLVPAVQISSRPSDTAWSDRNSIVLLGAGTVSRTASADPDVPIFAYGRITAAADAYFRCRARGKDCDIVVSGGDPERHGETEAAVYARTLSALGVPQTAIVLEARSRNTWQNAAFSTQLIPADRQIVVVTSGLHLKRSLLFFGHFRKGVEGIAADRVEAAPGLFQSGYNFFLTDALLHEQIGMAQYYVYNALGLNG